MKKYLIAAGVTSVLIAAQAMASDAAGLVGAPETAVAPVKAAETAAAPAAVARAVSNAAARPLMVAGEAGALSASSVAVPVRAEVTAPGMIGAVSRVPDRVATSASSYNAMLSASSQTGTCNISKYRYLRSETGGTGESTEIEGVTRDECTRRAEKINTFLKETTPKIFIAGAFGTWIAVANDDPESD